jgi:hypothetical protein
MAKAHKKEREEQLLLKQEREKCIEEMLRYSNKRFKKFDEVISQLHEGKDLNMFFQTDRRMQKIHECFSKSENPDIKARLKEIFIYLEKHSLLINDETLIHAVFNCFQFNKYWLNDIFNWKPFSKNASEQFIEIAGYLFCKYDVPNFLYKSFYDNNLLFIEWFIHLGIGGKAKEIKNIPIAFTQKMSHYFIHAPGKFNVTEALRWSQVMGLGGNEILAERIAFSWIGTKSFADEDFWESFLHLLARNALFNLNKITELIDYVREMKREDAGYLLKGRTLQSLIRQSDKWHGKYAHVKGNWFWKPCGIEGLQLVRKEDVIKIEELTEAKKLVQEGTAMKHCVASYTHYCATGKSAIYSLRKYSGGMLKDILATIEVNIFLKRIVQAKANMNKPISKEAENIMTHWAMKNSLGISERL